MAAGQNVTFRVWRINNLADDYVGGANVSGTIAYESLMVRFQANPEDQLLLQQGLEVQRTFTALVTPPNLDIRERDEFELTLPYNHPYATKRFRITSVRYSDFNPGDARGYMLLNLVRSVRSHKEQ